MEQAIVQAKQMPGIKPSLFSHFSRKSSQADKPFRKLKRIELIELILRLRNENQTLEDENKRLDRQRDELQQQYMRKIDRLETVCEDLRAELENMRSQQSDTKHDE